MEAGEGEAPSLVEPALELLMPQHDDLSRSLLTLDQGSTLIAVIEMSQASWLVAAIVPGIDRHPLKKIAAEGGPPGSFAPLAGRSGQSGAGDHAHRCRLRSRSRRLLACTLAAGARRRSPCDPPNQHRRFARAPAGQDGSARHRVAQACFSGVA